jgi:8-oxo-dGTP diphosphatase
VSEQNFTYKYPHPAVTVDCVVFGLDDGELKLLLVRRKFEPFARKWALPGGFVQIDEDLETAAFRELREETGVKDLYLEQLATFGSPDRDPRERVISVAYLSIVNLFDHGLSADTDASEAAWFPVEELPGLAFDHKLVIQTAVKRLRGKVRYEPLVFEFLPQKFTLTQVQKLYEKILGKQLDKRNFRKSLLATGFLTALDEYELDVSHRAAQFYVFNKEDYRKADGRGFELQL